jgi:hypothetical protein
MPYMYPTRLAVGSYFPETSLAPDGQAGPAAEVQQTAPPQLPGNIKIPSSGAELDEISQGNWSGPFECGITLPVLS